MRNLRWIILLILPMQLSCNDIGSPERKEPLAVGESQKSSEQDINQEGATAATANAASETDNQWGVQAAEPVSVAGAFLTCRLPTLKEQPESNYPIHCDLNSTYPTDAGWKFLVVRNGGSPVEAMATRLDALGSQWLVETPVLATDTTLSVIARYLNGDKIDAEASTALATEGIEARRNAVYPAPSAALLTDSAFYLTAAAPATLALLPSPEQTLYFSAGDLVDNFFNMPKVQTLKMVSLAESAASLYAVRLKEVSPGAIQFSIVNPKSTNSENLCLDVRGGLKNIAVGDELIRYACQTADNQSFEAAMDLNAQSFKIRSVMNKTFCAGTEAGSSKLVLVLCTAAASFRLSAFAQP